MKGICLWYDASLQVLLPELLSLGLQFFATSRLLLRAAINSLYTSFPSLLFGISSRTSCSTLTLIWKEIVRWEKDFGKSVVLFKTVRAVQLNTATGLEPAWSQGSQLNSYPIEYIYSTRLQELWDRWPRGHKLFFRSWFRACIKCSLFFLRHYIIINYAIISGFNMLRNITYVSKTVNRYQLTNLKQNTFLIQMEK